MSLKTLISSLSPSGKDAILLPFLTDYVLGLNRKLEKGTITRKQITIEDSRRSIAAFKQRIAEFNHGEGDPGAFHPSSFGACLRSLWFNKHNTPVDRVPKSASLRMHLIFETGSYFHMFFQNLFEAAGILQQREVPVVHKELNILGHCDAVIAIDGIKYAVEIKTIYSAGFSALAASGPHFEHKQQLMTYMFVLGIKAGIIIYYDKGTNNFREFVILYDEHFVKTHILPIIENRRVVMAGLRAPSRPSEFTPGKFPCSMCRHLTFCYNHHKVKQFERTLCDSSETFKQGRTIRLPLKGN